MLRTLVSLLVAGLCLVVGAASSHAAPPKRPSVVVQAELSQRAGSVKAARAEIRNARARLGLSRARIAKAAALQKRLTVKQRAALARVARRLLAASLAAQKQARLQKKKLGKVVTPTLERSIRRDLSLLGSKDVEAVSALTLQLAVDLQSQELRKVADSVDSKLEQLRRLRTSIVELRDTLAEWADGSVRTVSWVDAAGNTHTEKMTKEQAEALLRNLETEYAALNEQSDMASLDLQSAMQRQQQMLQTLSSIMKVWHDTLKATISNMK